MGIGGTSVRVANALNGRASLRLLVHARWFADLF
jgi:hypothetical protein